MRFPPCQEYRKPPSILHKYRSWQYGDTNESVPALPSLPIPTIKIHTRRKDDADTPWRPT